MLLVDADNSTSNPKEDKIKVTSLYKVFGKNAQRALKMSKSGKSKKDILKKAHSTIGVDDVSFSIKEGELFVVMGLSGSGKSTILRCLNRLHQPTAGSVCVDGTEILGLSEKEMRKFRQEHMSMVFQQFALLPHRTVLENATFGLEVRGIDRKTREDEARHALDLVGLNGWENEFPSQLSGGMKQRVGLARALASKPDILLMDEAFSALDPLIREEMQDLLLEILSNTGKTVVFITHDLNEALKLGDRIAFLRDGSLIQVGTPEDIVENPVDDYVAKFVRGVDRTRMLLTGDVMKKPHPYVKIQNGPSAALHTMKQNGISSVFVVDRGMQLCGIITVEQAIQARNKGIETLRDIELDQSEVLREDVPINDTLGMIAQSSLPIAVVNENNKLTGIIVRGSVLAALDPNRGDDENA